MRLHVNVGSPKTLLLADGISKTIRIHQECEGRIDKSPDGYIYTHNAALHQDCTVCK